MGVEIERKFLVTGDAWRSSAPGAPCVQGYLAASSACGVRVRILGASAWLTLKGPTRGCERLEFEYPIPVEDARSLLAAFCAPPFIEKTRYAVLHNGHTWEVDVFHGANAGLILAEIELDSADEAFDRPPWIGAEVTDRPEYGNFNLSRCPYGTWNE